jgi:23S rRNA pseudouridine2605 synthase
MGKQIQRSQTIRLNKLIADCGIASRREADRLIDEGHVRVNGKKVFEMGTQVNPNTDQIFVNGKPIKPVTMKLYMAFFKPAGVLTTMSDPHDRPNISHFLKDVPVRVFPVGRLDFDSEGLILLTNDGDFAQKITHPKNEVTKTYIVKLSRDPAPTQIQRLLRGVTIKDGKVAAKSLLKIQRGKDEHPWYKIVITEGKNRQIRQMFEKINNDVLKLQRVAIGRLTIGSLKRGQLVYINESSLDKIFQPDIPDAVIEKQGYKGPKQQSTKILKAKSNKKSQKIFRTKDKTPNPDA